MRRSTLLGATRWCPPPPPPLLTAGVKNAMLRSFLQIGSADRVVDLGCGNGRFLVWTSDAKAYLLGIDAAPYFAEETRRDIDLLVGDLRRLPLADGVATKGYSLDVCEHLSLDGLALMLKEAARSSCSPTSGRTHGSRSDRCSSTI